MTASSRQSRRSLAPLAPAVLAAALAGTLLGALLATGSRPAIGQSVLPSNVELAVRQFLSPIEGVPASEVRILRAEPVTWSDGCLGVYQPNVACTLALVDGWVVWAAGTGAAVRLHTDSGSAGASGTTKLKIGAFGIDVALVADAMLPPGATPRGASGKYLGKTPAPGSLGLLVTEESATAPALADSLSASGCVPESVAVVLEGEWRVYIPGAPAAVNARFPASLPPTSAFAVRCAS